MQKSALESWLNQGEPMFLKKVTFLAILATLVSLAAPIQGRLNFVSEGANLLIPDINTATFGWPSYKVVSPSSGDFEPSQGTVGDLQNISGTIPIVGFMNFDGFSIDVQSYGHPSPWQISNSANGDQTLSLVFNGLVRKNGFEDTQIKFLVSAQFSGSYDPTRLVTWIGSGFITENRPSAVPEPITFVLMGAGLIGIAALRRRRTT